MDRKKLLLVFICCVSVVGIVLFLAAVLPKKSRDSGVLPETNASTRETWLDALKVISAFFIVLIHTVGSGYSGTFGTTAWSGFLVLNMVPRFAVGIFIMISGALMLEKDISLRLAARRAGWMIIVLVFWNLVFLTLQKALWGGTLKEAIQGLIRIPIKQQFSGHLWYVYFLVWLYLFSPVVGKLYRSLTLRQRIYFICITTLLPGALNLYSTAFDLGGTDIIPSWFLYMSFPYTGLLFLGRVIYEEADRLRHSDLIGSGLIILGLCGLILLSANYSKIHGHATDAFLGESKLFPVLFSSGVFLIAAKHRGLWNQIPEWLKRSTAYLSKRSLGIYLFHPAVIWMIGTISWFGLNLDPSKSVGAAMICCLIYWVISIGCVSVMSQIPILRNAVMQVSSPQGVSTLSSLLKKYHQYQFLFEELVKRDFKKKYKRTVLGMAWSVLSPLLTLLVMRLVFTQFFGRNMPHYTTYLFCGNLVFSFFNESSTQGMSSLINNAGIFTKVNVPKYMFLLSKNVQCLINFGLTLCVFVFFCILDRITFTWKFILLIYPICCEVIFNIGIGMILSALFVFFRDTQYLWSVFTQLLMYMSAIFYTIDKYSETVQKAFLINPVYLFIRYFRKIVLEASIPTPQFHLLMLADALIALGIGCRMYKKYNQKFLYYV